MANRSIDPVTAELTRPAARQRLLQLARSILHEDSDAEDAVHDAVVQALRASAGFREEARASTWLHRVTVNASLMTIRKRNREQLRAPARPANDSDDGPLVELARHRDDNPGPAALLEAREENLRLRRAVAALPALYEEVVRLCLIDELPLPDAARALGISASAVRTRICRARGFLRQRLAA
jgi:RNA polymerase sigma-70 factor (ECF subfamily)